MKNVVLIIFLLSSISLFSQYEYPEKENSEAVLNSTLAFQLLDEETEFDTYANEAVQEAFKENWKLTEVVFLSKAEINKLKEAKDTKYAYLTHNDELLKEMRMNHLSKNPNSTIFGRSYGMGVNAPTESISYQRVAFTFAYYSYNLEIIGKKKPKSALRMASFQK